jgi:hypothetical protein
VAYYTLPRDELLPRNCLVVENKRITAEKYRRSLGDQALKTTKARLRALKEII